MTRHRPRSTFGGDHASLTAAELVARALEAPFDREATKALAQRLHQAYYLQLGAVLGEPFTTTPFDASALRNVNAYAERSTASGADTIYFDEQLDFWLLTCVHLTTVAACKALSAIEYRSLIQLLMGQLDVPGNPYLHERHQARFKGFMMRHVDCLELSHALSRAMVVFVMCHEVAHTSLGHTAEEQRIEHEIEADRLAASFFTRVIDAGAEAGLIFIHPKLAGAPVLWMRLFDLLERHIFRQSGTKISGRTHPPALTRAAWLEGHLSDRLNPDARYILDGFVAALDDIARLEELPTVS